MKHSITAVCAVIIVIMMMLSSCSFFITTLPADFEITEPTIKSVPQDETKTPDTTAPEETEAPTTVTEPTTEEPKPSVEEPSFTPGSSVEVEVGETPKGFKITEKDGITYVNGIMIANKTYSLPSSYNPGDLTSDCRAAFNEMKKSAAEDGCNLYVSSGFRSYSLQKSLYSRYCARDGKAAADRYSARPGNSEHQTGYAIDLNTISYSFANTTEGKWVAENCHKYGFILRYPENKEAETGYRYEPWHIRYVGISLATDIYNSGLCLEEYFGITSQYD